MDFRHCKQEMLHVLVHLIINVFLHSFIRYFIESFILKKMGKFLLSMKLPVCFQNSIELVWARKLLICRPIIKKILPHKLTTLMLHYFDVAYKVYHLQ